MSLIQPIDAEQQRRVVAATQDYIRQAEAVFQRRFALPPVTFDLRGRAAGMYRVVRRQRAIRYNPYVFAKYFDDNLAVTVPHEVAHYITDCIFGLRNIRPHGREWKMLMQTFGADDRVTCSYDLTGVPVRRYKRYPYRCGCDNHQLTSLRHNKVQRGQARYYCRRCAGELLPGTDE